MSETFDWRTLAPEPTSHSCDCEYCDHNGELDPILWPALRTYSHSDVDYVTDGYLALRADLAPVPDGYEGPLLPAGPLTNDWMDAWVTASPATGAVLRQSTLGAIEQLGGRLRCTTWPPKKTGSQVLAITVEGRHVGWAISAPAHQDAPGFREYQEPEQAVKA